MCDENLNFLTESRNFFLDGASCSGGLKTQVWAPVMKLPGLQRGEMRDTNSI